jgi:ribose 5-phosphate isomerase B
VAEGAADQGIVCCYTGTGVSMAANKVTGVRAALCGDAETARGARQWNDANVLALSLRLTSPALAREIVRAWSSTPYGGSEGKSLDALQHEEQRSGAAPAK